MNRLDKIVSVIAWLQIFISPVLIGGMIAIATWLYFQSVYGKVLAVIVFIAGIFVGIKLAQRARNKQGTLNFISRISETPELNSKD